MFVFVCAPAEGRELESDPQTTRMVIHAVMRNINVVFDSPITPPSTPKVFFNTKHLGGADDVKILASTGELRSLHGEMRDTHAPTHADFQRPNHPPMPRHTRASLREPQICIGGQCMSYGAISEMLVAEAEHDTVPLAIATHVIRGKKYDRTFKGTNLIDALLSRFRLPGGTDL